MRVPAQSYLDRFGWYGQDKMHELGLSELGVDPALRANICRWLIRWYRTGPGQPYHIVWRHL